MLQGQHTAPAAELLQAAAELALCRAQLLSSGMASSACISAGATSSQTAKQLVKKCKAHVTALVELSAHEAAMAAVVRYIPQLHRVGPTLWTITGRSYVHRLGCCKASLTHPVQLQLPTAFS